MISTAIKTEHRALLSYDFKLTDLKAALMQLCFSPLANWPLFVLAMVLYFNPFRYQYQILSGAPSLLAFIYSPQWATGIAIGMICSYFIGIINIPIVLILYFVSQGEVHTILAASILTGVFLGRALKYLKLAIKLEGQTKSIVIWFALIQLVSLVVAVGINLWIYQAMSFAGYFSRTLFAYRFEFIVISLFVVYVTQLVLNSLWGHFYSRRAQEPSKINTFFSMAVILRRLGIGKVFAQQLKAQVTVKHAELSLQLQDTSATYLPKNILQIAQTEKQYLELALRFWSSLAK